MTMSRSSRALSDGESFTESPWHTTQRSSDVMRSTRCASVSACGRALHASASTTATTATAMIARDRVILSSRSVSLLGLRAQSVDGVHEGVLVDRTDVTSGDDAVRADEVRLRDAEDAVGE